MEIIHGSLFSGIGGFDLGFALADIKTAWVSEIDKSCNRVHRLRWPGVQNIGDVNGIGKGTSPVRIISGGFPCQDLSVAGRREGLAGERSGLWYQFHRILKELRPRWVVIENVTGLLSSYSGPEPPSDLEEGEEWEAIEESDFGIVLRGLVGIGYGVSWRVFDAQYFGVAQRRRRVIIVGSLGSGRSAKVLFEREGGCWNPAPSREKRKGDTNNLEGSTGGYSTPWDIERCRIVDEDGPCKALAADHGRGHGVPSIFQWASGGGDDLKDTAQALRANAEYNYQLVVETFQATGKGWWKQSDVGGTLTKRDHRDGESNLVAEHFSFADREHSIGATMGEISDTLMAHPQTDTSNMQKGVIVQRPFSPHHHYEYEETEEASTLHNLHRQSSGSEILTVAFDRTQGTVSGEIAGTLRACGATKEGVNDGKADAQCVVWHDSRRDGARIQDDVSPTVEQFWGTGGNNVPLVGVRRLTPRESERIQGFPDDWTRWGRKADGELVELSDTARYKMLGNAFPVPLAYWIGDRIAKIERGEL